VKPQSTNIVVVDDAISVALPLLPDPTEASRNIR
jgi:hypothetical protein